MSILISIPSRDRPELLQKGLREIYDTASDVKNFAIHGVIDEDQVGLYQPLIAQYPNILWDFIPHQGGGMRHLYMRAFEKMMSTDHYFLWQVCDDTYGYPKDWDKTILEKKKVFDDDCYCLYTITEIHARNNKVKASCYSINHQRACDPPGQPVKPTDWAMFHGMGELSPVFAKQWVPFLKMFYDHSPCPGGNDMVTAALLQQLYMLHGHNRNVEVKIDNINCINHYVNHHLMSVDKKPFTIKQVQFVANEMAKYIQSHAK